MKTDLTKGNLPFLMIRFMVPFLAANLLTDLYNMVDMIIIGHFVGSAGIVSVTMGGRILTICTSISIGLSSGGQIYIAQQAGAGKAEEEMNRSVGTLLTALGILSAVIMIMGILWARPFLTWMHTPLESMTAAVHYLRITCIGLPMVFGYTAFSSVLRGMGDSKRPLMFVAVAAVLNLLLDIIFVGCFHMGVQGAAYATLIGQCAAFVFSVVYLYRRRKFFIFDFRVGSFAIDPHKLGIMMKIGIPMAAQSFMIMGTQLVMIGYVNALGLLSATVFSVADKIVTMSNLVNQSINAAGGSVVAQNVGAKQYDRAGRSVYVALCITLPVAGAASIISCLFPELLFGIFTTDPQVLAYAPIIMRIAVWCYFLSSIIGSFSMITTGTGQASLAFLAGLLDGVVFRFGFSWLFGIHLGMGVVGFFLANTFARLGPLLVHTVYFYSGKWKNDKNIAD